MISYVEDFLHFPAGTIVPNGYFDRAHDVWKAGDNGVVLSVLANDGGVATIEADGDGKADTTAALTKAGISADELSVLAQKALHGSETRRQTRSVLRTLLRAATVPPRGTLSG